MANTSPCSDCQFYDPILKGMQPTPRGWCVKKSLYPFRDSPGQQTPPNAKRVASMADLAKPHIVEGKKVVADCNQYAKLVARKSKAELQKLARGGKK